MFRLNIGKEKALQKIKQYCAYQERNHQETKEKLYGYGLYKTDVEEIISILIEENFLNEERFAIAFAGGKFRMKQWGKIKIQYELKLKRVGAYNIKTAIASIDEEAYGKTLDKLFKTKLASLKSEKNIFVKKKKVQQYLIQKGYELQLINALVNSI